MAWPYNAHAMWATDARSLKQRCRPFWVALIVLGTVACNSIVETNTMQPLASNDATPRLVEVSANSEASASVDVSVSTEDVAQTEIDPMQPIPNVAIVLHKHDTDGYNLQLKLENYLLRPLLADGPVMHGVGTAHLHINGEQTIQITGEWTHIRSDMLTEGENELLVALNANDGSLWTRGGGEIDAQLIFSPQSEFPLYSDNITYALDWVNVAPTITNDLGYTIALETAQLHSAAVELAPCVESSWLDWFMPGVAYGGHGTSAIVETRAVLSVVETVGAREPLTVGQASASQSRYCQMHYLVAPSVDTPTLLLSGTYLAPDATVPLPFNIESDLAWGGMLDLATPIDPSNTPHTLLITRDFEGLFNGVDFATHNESEQAKAVLRALLKGAVITTIQTNGEQ